MYSKARSCRDASKSGANSSWKSVIFPSAWIAMNVRIASTTSSLFNFTVSLIHSWIHAQDCWESLSSSLWLRMKASCCPITNQNTDSMAHIVWACLSSALVLKYVSSGKALQMLALNGRSDIAFDNNSLASCRPFSANSFNTAWLVTGIHIFGTTTASYSFLRSKSKGKSWKVTEPPNDFAKLANASSLMVTTALLLFLNSRSADWYTLSKIFKAGARPTSPLAKAFSKKVLELFRMNAGFCVRPSMFKYLLNAFCSSGNKLSKADMHFAPIPGSVTLHKHASRTMARVSGFCGTKGKAKFSARLLKILS
mmetsp:Transcript_44638/g.129896  ORF Transcript_44638/g.129896 Transcript_44638/m.129896 type:complete len:310 (+) Transcript_44638:1387-2316(+)